jgi:hypothetical protein
LPPREVFRKGFAHRCSSPSGLEWTLKPGWALYRISRRPAGFLPAGFSELIFPCRAYKIVCQSLSIIYLGGGRRFAN